MARLSGLKLRRHGSGCKGGAHQAQYPALNRSGVRRTRAHATGTMPAPTHGEARACRRTAARAGEGSSVARAAGRRLGVCPSALGITARRGSLGRRCCQPRAKHWHLFPPKPLVARSQRRRQRIRVTRAQSSTVRWASATPQLVWSAAPSELGSQAAVVHQPRSSAAKASTTAPAARVTVATVVPRVAAATTGAGAAAARAATATKGASRHTAPTRSRGWDLATAPLLQPSTHTVACRPLV